LPKSFVEEVESGDRMRALVALRGELARAIDSCTDAADLSSLALRLQRTLEQIDDLGGAGKQEEPDDLAARRAAKLSAATGS
jgi:hypothetical protein